MECMSTVKGVSMEIVQTGNCFAQVVKWIDRDLNVIAQSYEK